LKPSASRGDLCFAPGEGQRVKFTRPHRWLGGWEHVDAGVGMRAVLRRFLATYGPVTRDDVARWLGITSAPAAMRLLESLGDELTCVAIAGTGDAHWMLAADLDELRGSAPSTAVRLLPGFDQYVVTSPRDREAILPQAHRAQIHRPQGWISPVLCIGGVFRGVWKHERKGRNVRIEVAPFGKVTRAEQRGIVTEAERLGAYLDATPDLTIHAPGKVALF
ncbi:MAG TPA: crosslink repair DNA glycosylase YcaQ family protein, partial [Thermomicrobiales bacterium]|nr:crosslink repair DNA glycosylase YcaQ family protein [Thermomicrobiales bacterium]